MNLSNVFTQILEGIITTLAAALLIGLFKFCSKWVRRRAIFISRKRNGAIIRVSKEQIKEFGTSTVNSSKERKDAIGYLLHDTGIQLEQLHSIETQWRKKRFMELLNSRNIVAIATIFFIIQLLGLWLFGNIFIKIVYSLLVMLLLVEIAVLALWVNEGIRIDKKYKRNAKEVNQALLAIGPKLKINLRELLTLIYDREDINDPLLIKKQLQSIGIVIERSELMRVTLAYRIKNKSETERIEITSKIIGGATDNPSAYKSIPDQERKNVEKMFLENYVDDPYAEVQIIPI